MTTFAAGGAPGGHALPGAAREDYRRLLPGKATLECAVVIRLFTVQRHIQPRFFFVFGHPHIRHEVDEF